MEQSACRREQACNIRAWSMGEVSGVVARRAKYPLRDNLSSAGDHEFRHELTSGATEVIGEGQGESALEQEPGSVTEEAVLESALEWAPVEWALVFEESERWYWKM